MRRTKTAGTIALAWWLGATSSWAQQQQDGAVAAAGEPKAAPPAQEPAAASTAGESPPVAAPATNPDTANRRVEQTKPWEIGASIETHRMIRQDDLGGAAPNKVFNVYGVYAKYDLSEHDHIGVGDVFDQRFIADSGETGFRSGDVTFRYTRTQPLARQFSFAATAAISAPTSFSSQKASIITAPSLLLALDKRIGKYVALSARTGGSAFITKYSSAEGGSPNPKWRATLSAEAEVTMPFHEPLSIGIDVATAWLWLYQVQGAGGAPNGATDDAQYPTQPVSQSYAGEIFVRYVLPSLAGVKSDFSVALADGDPALSYNSVLHDGVSQFYLFFRQTAEVYGTFSVRY